MTPAEALEELKSLGTERTRKTYLRHGAAENCYGVSYGDMEKLRKRIKRDHTLALDLWKSGVHEGRILATMIADPDRLDAKTLDAMARELDGHIVGDALAGMAARSPVARGRMEKWIRGKDEWIARSGWRVLGELAMHDESLPDDYFEPYLAVIADGIHDAKNRVREAMNGALIAIGSRSEGLRRGALDVAARIGRVEVDHGDTACKTPDAAEYILRVAERGRGRKGKG